MFDVAVDLGVWLLLILTGAVLVRAFLGPALTDRLLAVNMITTKLVALFLLLALQEGNWVYLDVALVFVLAACVATVAIVKFFQEGSLL